MAADSRIPRDVLEAAIGAAGEIRRHYKHSSRDFETDVSAMLVAAYTAWMRPDSQYFQAPDAAS